MYGNLSQQWNHFHLDVCFVFKERYKLYVEICDCPLTYPRSFMITKMGKNSFAVAFRLYDLRQTGYIECEEVSTLQLSSCPHCFFNILCGFNGQYDHI